MPSKPSELEDVSSSGAALSPVRVTLSTALGVLSAAVICLTVLLSLSLTAPVKKSFLDVTCLSAINQMADESN